jgi:hypothetical protein
MNAIYKDLLEKGIITKEQYNGFLGIKDKLAKPKVKSAASPKLEEVKKKRGRPKKENVVIRPEVNALVEQMGGAKYKEPTKAELDRANKLSRKKVTPEDVQKILDDLAAKQKRYEKEAENEDRRNPVTVQNNKMNNALDILRQRGRRV